MNSVVEAMYYQGKSVHEVMEATGLTFGFVRQAFSTLNYFQNEYQETMSQNRLLQISAIEKALWIAIEEYQKDMSAENRKKVNELQHSYCNFIV